MEVETPGTQMKPKYRQTDITYKLPSDKHANVPRCWL